MKRHKSTAAALLVLLLSGVCRAGTAAVTNMLPDSSFESGEAGKVWAGFGFGERVLASGGHDGERCLSIRGNGSDTGWWYASRWTPVQYNRVYGVSYWVRCDARRPGGSVFAGVNLVNRKATAARDWAKQEFFFRAPSYLPSPQFRLGQSGVDGTVYFDEVTMRPALAVHRSRALGRYVLGAGESLVEGRYTAVHEMSGRGSSDCRFLHSYTATFDHDRWVLNKLDEVVYRHQVSYYGVADLRSNVTFGPVAKANLGVVETDPRCIRALLQRSAAVELVVPYCEGDLSVQFSLNGIRGPWKAVQTISRPSLVRVTAPTSLLPTRELWVRLKSMRAARVEVMGYRYSSLLGKMPGQKEWRLPVAGDTRYMTILDENPVMEIRVTDLGEMMPGGRSEVRAVLTNRGDRRRVRVSALVQKENALISRSEQDFYLARGSVRQVYLPYQVDPAGQQTLRLIAKDARGDELLGLLESRFEISALREATGGELLASDTVLDIWWCEPERKVSRARPVPTVPGEGLRIRAAGNEYEAAQLVLRPKDRLQDLEVRAGDLVAQCGARIAGSEIEIRRVGYVGVALPSDESGVIGEWPDPLPAQAGPADLSPGINHPFWITVYVPTGTPAGEYRGEVVIAARGFEQRVPLLVQVWGFELPRETHLRSGCGLASGLIRRYHNLKTKEELDQVVALYLEAFAAHRVTAVGAGDDIWVDWRKGPKGEVEPFIEFAEFDEDTQRALDELGFGIVVVKPPGLGERGLRSWQPGNISGFKQGTAQHEAAFGRGLQAIENHLAERGWLDKVYVRWPKKPHRDDLAAIREGLELINRAGPKLKRMVTMVPEHCLYGAVDAWCVPVHGFDPTLAAERRAAGEEVWWHFERAAKGACLSSYMDRGGTEMRLWPWQTWRYGLDGIWLWHANYWNSTAAYPGRELQNPWDDPMSWASDPSLEPGKKVAWGNGYGRLLYPPNLDPAEGEEKYFSGPVPSVRWELLRDGIEDYEYLWLLRAEVERLKEAGVGASVYQEAEKLLEVPAEVCADTTHFATTPEPIYAHRAKVAEAIVLLRGEPASERAASLKPAAE